MMCGIPRSLLVLVGLAALVAMLGCGSSDTAPPGPSGDEVRSNKTRDTSPDVAPEDLATLVTGNTEFALALYRQIKADEQNLFYSPFSVSLAFSMLYAGARGNTARQMAQVLGYHLDPATHHAAFNKLDLELASRGRPAAGVSGAAKPEGFQLSIANAMWGQRGFAFEAAFLDTLAVNYGAGLRVADFETDPEGARQAVNRWVAEQTADRIRNILPPGSITNLTRFVLANAIYFLAAWEDQFDPRATSQQPFYALNGSTGAVPMMHRTGSMLYAEGQDFQAVELPYEGDQLGMVILLPAQGQFTAFETSLTAPRLAGIVGQLAPRTVSLALPRFGIETPLDLVPVLSAMGMPDAFSTTDADFSGICSSTYLYVAVALHKAFVAVDEAGTEAGAATVIGGATTSMPQHSMTVNRPFVFLIRDRPTGTVLFLGRVVQL